MSHSSLKCVKNAKTLSHFPVRWETHHFPLFLSLLTTTSKDHALYSNTDSHHAGWPRATDAAGTHFTL